MQRNIKRKIFSWLLAFSCAVFLFTAAGAPDAAAKTKWQKMLEQNGVSRSLWSKYLPTITRNDYNKVKKLLAGSSKVHAAKASKWQLMLERNGIDPSLWQKYLPKVSRKEYNKVKKMTNGGGNQASVNSLGPDISVGLWYFSKDDSDPFKISANKNYNIKDEDGHVLAQIDKDTQTRVQYDDDGKLEISGSVASTIVKDKVTFDAADGNNSDLIFDVNEPNTSYDHFRGTIEVNYYHGEDKYNGNNTTVTQIWVVNKLPLEQYVWGMGETTGTGPKDHVRVMATIFRTYGFWYIENATKYNPMGFKIRSDSGSQIYGGYDWEKDHSNIREAADATRAQIVLYKGEAALTPYCSYTDGWTRPYPKTKRSSKPDPDYPYLKSVKDNKEGKKKGLKPGDGGNHMWGLSAHGALGYAKAGKSWQWILKHYYSKVDIKGAY